MACRVFSQYRKGVWAVIALGAAALAFQGGAIYGDEDHSDGSHKGTGSFHERNDAGDDVHVLPSPETLAGLNTKEMFAPANHKSSVYAPSYGSGNLINHGGGVMHSPQYYAIYWNAAVAGSSATSLKYSSIQSQIAAFIGTFFTGLGYTGSATDDYSIVAQYTDSSGSPVPAGAGLVGQFVDSKTTQTTITDAAIQSYLKTVFAAQPTIVNRNTIYGVYFPHGMQVQLSRSSLSCSSFCGYHSSFTYNGAIVKYAVFPYPDCSGCKLSTLSVADMLTIVGSHEIREAVTDSANSWYDKTGYEADDKCAWHNLYQMNRTAGLNFWVQPEFSNGGTVNGVTYPGLSNGVGGCARP